MSHLFSPLYVLYEWSIGKFPGIPSVIDDLADAVQAVLALRAPGYNARDIHIMASWDYVEAVVQKRQQQSYPSKKLMSFLSFFDEGFFDVYLHEARRGYHILSVRLSSHKQALPLRRLLAAHHAHLVKYLDTWTVAELLP